jgi:precorrin-4/cobalt-precorrin-4 C11-methyltransferase
VSGDAVRGKVWFVGAGPGAADLLTLRAARVIAEADVVIWAASLVMAEAVAGARPDAEVIDSSRLTLEQVTVVYDRAAAEGLTVARVHSGDPALWGAVAEQIEACQARGLDWEIVPGVSSLSAAAAAIGRELTIPEVAQSVILTRLATATPMPGNEDVRAFAAHGTTMALFLSAKRGRKLEQELLAGGYPPDTPCAIVHKATWPDEVVRRCRLDELAATLREERLWKHTLILVGPALEAGGTRSHLYAPGFAHQFRNPRALANGAPGEAPSS